MSMSTVHKLKLAALLLLTACGSDSAPTVIDGGALLSLAAHNPTTHGVTGSIAIQSQHAYADVDGGSVTVRGGSVHLTVGAGGPIPRIPDSFIRSIAVFGYAWADLDTGAAIVSVIHPVIGRDSHQNPDGWHTHPVQLGAGTGASDFCIVSIGGSQAGIRIVGDAMSLSVPARFVPVGGAALDVVASFVVKVDAGCAGSGLGVAILDAAGL
ncbi:MAG TPA: hypothetical protein VK939_02910 [Longimicrobiales bacterium]|nr:hypothetical protein [Longimicrobiales bacterium]